MLSVHEGEATRVQEEQKRGETGGKVCWISMSGIFQIFGAHPVAASTSDKSPFSVVLERSKLADVLKHVYERWSIILVWLYVPMCSAEVGVCFSLLSSGQVSLLINNWIHVGFILPLITPTMLLSQSDDLVGFVLYINCWLLFHIRIVYNTCMKCKNMYIDALEGCTPVIWQCKEGTAESFVRNLFFMALYHGQTFWFQNKLLANISLNLAHNGWHKCNYGFFVLKYTFTNMEVICCHVVLSSCRSLMLLINWCYVTSGLSTCSYQLSLCKQLICCCVPRPYHAILLMEEEDTLCSSLPEDASPCLRRLIQLSSPLKRWASL